MIHELAEIAFPSWLAEVLDGDGSPTFHLRRLLEGSLYYPSCGFNGTPVKFLGGNILSFVFADHAMSRESLLQHLHSPAPDGGFKGYEPILKRDVPFGDAVQSRIDDTRSLNATEGAHALGRKQVPAPFAHWSVWRRMPGFPSSHGPRGFSLFFIGGEMSVVYQGLYCRLAVAPRVLTIIQPGVQQGASSAEDAGLSRLRSVALSNMAGLPDYLLYGGFGRGFYESPCWPEYSGEVITRLPERYAGLWKQRNQ